MTSLPLFLLILAGHSQGAGNISKFQVRQVQIACENLHEISPREPTSMTLLLTRFLGKVLNE